MKVSELLFRILSDFVAFVFANCRTSMVCAFTPLPPESLVVSRGCDYSMSSWVSLLSKTATKWKNLVSVLLV